MRSTRAPSGTITFLFSDIEGSTERWERDRTAMEIALRSHDALVRAALEEHGGYVFKTIGDAFCAAFERPDAAVAAALSAQRRLAAEDYSAVDGLTIRIALHAGTADERDGEYFGPALSRIARLLGAAWGGQTVLSSGAAELVRGSLPAGVELLDLGEHRLRDLAQPERVSQLVVPDLANAFPPLRSLDGACNTLPAQGQPLIGREDLVAEIAAAVLAERMLTLVAMGGVGKTRTALHVAGALRPHFPGGVCYVDLASISQPLDVDTKVLADLGLRQSPGRTPLDTVLSWLASREALVVVDNCEHVVAGAARVASALLAGAPKIRILATSREALRIGGERVLRVPNLRVPPESSALSADDALAYESVALFVQRARAISPSFALSDAHASVVADICRRLDGIALAIELAASRVHVLSPPQLATKLNERFRLLTGGRREAAPRQATLHATISWSYDLLEGRERRVFEILAAFAGAWSLDAGVRMCRDATLDDFDAIDALEALADKSLLAVEGDPDERTYRLLESTRAFALLKLRERGAEREVRSRHAAYAVDVAAALDRAATQVPTAEWERDANACAADLRAAIVWSLHDGNDERLGIELVANMRWFWSGVAAAEGRAELLRALETVKRSQERPEIVARVHIGLATVSTVFRDYTVQRASAECALQLLEHGGDPLERAYAKRLYAQALWFGSGSADAVPLMDEVLADFRKLGQPRYVELALQDRGMERWRSGELVRARNDLVEAIGIATAGGFERDLLALQINLAEIEFALGDVAASIASARAALERTYAMREPATFAVGWSNLAMYYGMEQQWSAAWSAAETALAFACEAGDALNATFALQSIAAARAASGDLAAAAELLGYVDAQLALHDAERGATESAQYDSLCEAIAGLDPAVAAARRDAGSRLDRPAAELLAFPLPLAGRA